MGGPDMLKVCYWSRRVDGLSKAKGKTLQSGDCPHSPKKDCSKSSRTHQSHPNSLRQRSLTFQIVRQHYLKITRYRRDHQEP